MKMSQFVMTTVLIYFWFALTGCGKSTPGSTAEEPTPGLEPSTEVPKTPVSRRAPDTFSIQATGLSEPNKYVVRISADSLSSHYQIYRQQTNGNEKLVGTMNKDASAFEDNEVEAGKEYEYTLARLDNTEKKQTLYVTIPKDLVINSTVNQVRSHGYARVFLTEQARIQTEGQDFVLEANELISNGAVLETYTEGTKAPAGAEGRTPGRIVIKANSARGSLTIFNRGENGGDGQNGSRGSNGGKGDTGANASSHHIPNPLRPPHCGGFPGNLDPVCKVIPDAIVACASQPVGGGQGRQGNPGTAGTAGARGGNTAALQIKIESADSFKLVTNNIPGIGGNGGVGGEGGDGGPGGDPGQSSEGCGNAGSGPQGAKGANGANGEKGADGTVTEAH